MAKMEAGKETVEFEFIEDVENELHKIINTFGCEAKAKGIDLHIDIKGQLPVVRWDMDRLRYHVLNNLVSNALKHTPHGGCITLSVEAIGGLVLIRVADTGTGIPEKIQGKLFSRFGHIEYRSERTNQGD